MSPELFGALRSIEPLTARLLAAMRVQPGSDAERDDRQREGRYALELAASALSIGCEHLEAWRVLGAEARWLPPYAFLTLIRTAIECAVLARWLLEPGITRDERRSRGIGAQWEDYDERRKFENAAKVSPDPPGKPARERQRELERRADRLGLKVRKPLNRIELFERFVAPTARADGVRLGGVLYRVLSGTAHGHQWTLLSAEKGELVIEPQTHHVQINEAAASTATQLTMLVMTAALSDLERYTTGSRVGKLST